MNGALCAVGGGVWFDSAFAHTSVHYVQFADNMFVMGVPFVGFVFTVYTAKKLEQSNDRKAWF